jgi:hypothetical protein
VKYNELAGRRSKPSKGRENPRAEGAGWWKTQGHRTSTGNVARGARNLTGGAGSPEQLFTSVKRSHKGKRVAKARLPRHAATSQKAKTSSLRCGPRQIGTLVSANQARETRGNPQGPHAMRTCMKGRSGMGKPIHPYTCLLVDERQVKHARGILWQQRKVFAESSKG